MMAPASRPPTYRQVWGIAVGAIVSTEFGPAPDHNRYHSGPYEVTAITGPLPQQPWFLDDMQTDRAAHNGQPVIHLSCAGCALSPPHLRDATGFSINDVYPDPAGDGWRLAGGGRLFVQPNPNARPAQLALGLGREADAQEAR
jgi:hypothetical protein